MKFPFGHCSYVAWASRPWPRYSAAFVAVPKNIAAYRDHRRDADATIAHRFSWLIIALAAALSGCRSEPFQQPALPSLINPNPQTIRDQFPQQLPDPFTSDDTVILQAPFHDDLAVLGVLNVNRQARTFELYGLNQMGVVYFHVGGDRNTVAIREAVPPLMEHKEILLSMAHDIQHIYLDPAPADNSAVDISSTEITFSQPTKDGTIVYNFGMQPTVLLQKQLNHFFGPTWRVRYYDYRPGEAGKLFPHDIVMDNFQFHYRIIIKNRDWSIQEKQ